MHSTYSFLVKNVTHWKLDRFLGNPLSINWPHKSLGKPLGHVIEHATTDGLPNCTVELTDYGRFVFKKQESPMSSSLKIANLPNALRDLSVQLGGPLTLAHAIGATMSALYKAEDGSLDERSVRKLTAKLRAKFPGFFAKE